MHATFTVQSQDYLKKIKRNTYIFLSKFKVQIHAHTYIVTHRNSLAVICYQSLIHIFTER